MAGEAESATSSTETSQSAEGQQTYEGCINVRVATFADRFEVTVSVFGAIGVRVRTDSPDPSVPSEGAALAVYILPDLCKTGVTLGYTLSIGQPASAAQDTLGLLP